MAVTKTGTKAVKIYNPQHLLITPFVEGVKGSKTYDFDDVIRDSTTLTQDDAEENKVENEFRPAPIVNNISIGSFTFATRIGDMQPDLLADIAGFEKDSVSSKVYAPEAYKEVFAEITLVFNTGGKNVACIMPKVQLNPKVLIESLHSSVGSIDINGIGFMLDVVDGSNHHNSPFYIDPDFKMPE